MEKDEDEDEEEDKKDVFQVVRYWPGLLGHTRQWYLGCGQY